MLRPGWNVSVRCLVGQGVKRLVWWVLPVVFVSALSCRDSGEGHIERGAPGAGDPLFPWLGNSGYDVSHYGLTLDYEPDGNRLKASALITARATQALRTVDLDLDGLRVRQATVDGKSAGVRRAGTKLTLTPEGVVGKDRIFTTEVVYEGRPKEITGPDGGLEGWIRTGDGAVGLGEPAGSMAWFPGNHRPSDKASYDITVTVPEGRTAVANGRLARHHSKDGRETFAWHNPEPMAGYLASVAIGYFKVDDFTADGLPVYIATDPKQAGKGPDMKMLVPEVIKWGSKLFGPYPFNSAGAVIDYLPSLGYALETQTKPYFQKTPDQTTVVHELAHQWFGNSVTPRTWRDMWLNEGFAQYAEWMWEEDHDDRTTEEIFDAFYDGTDDDSGDDTWKFPPGNPPADDVSGDPVYDRGAMTLHKLRQAVGYQKFIAILRAWVAEHRHGNADTRQFIALCEKQSGKDLSSIFDTWLYEKGKPPRG